MAEAYDSGSQLTNDELVALFECPVCYETALPPIIQCRLGHIVCSDCRPRLSQCPQCRQAFGHIDIRNVALERLAFKVKFPCKHKQTGCHLILNVEEKSAHEEHCEFRLHSCPFPSTSCTWQGKLDNVMFHVRQVHTNIGTLTSQDVEFLAIDVINARGQKNWITIQRCFEQDFIVILKRQLGNHGYVQFYGIVQLIGTRMQAELFSYKMELKANTRRLTYEGTPRTSHEEVTSAIKLCDCLVFDERIVKLFSQNRNLSITVTISAVA